MDIVWFKRDLRVFDHAPLADAVHDADFVLPLFVLIINSANTIGTVGSLAIFCLLFRFGWLFK